MSDLLVDLGNSRIKWAWAGALEAWQASEWRAQGLDAVLEAHWRTLPVPMRVFAAAVAPVTIREKLQAWVWARWGRNVVFVQAGRDEPDLIPAYDPPERLGADRWAALVAARAHYPAGALVVDCGTAVTLDAVAGRRHLGGFILPGIQGMRSLLEREVGLAAAPADSVADGEWGRSTETCIALGTAGAVAALAEHALERLQAAGVCDPALVVTGGEAGFLSSLLQVDYRRHDTLVLEGVWLCSRRFTE